MPTELKSIAENMNACEKKRRLKRLNRRDNGGELKHRLVEFLSPVSFLVLRNVVSNIYFSFVSDIWLA